MLEERPALPEWIEARIGDFLDSPRNRLRPGGEERAWDGSLVGFAGGDDPLFADIKGHIGPFYWTPAEAFRAALPSWNASPAGLTVISWILPQTAATRADNAAEARRPAERWALSKHEGERINDDLRRHLADCLTAAGYQAVAPTLAPGWQTVETPDWGRASSWSERHAAFVAGLGTFGLCDGLITRAGKAHRCGSVIVAAPMAPTPRPYSDRHEYCLFFRNGSCRACADRCPAKAVSTAGGHDKARCRTYLELMSRSHIEPRFGFATGACGLCQTGVPCESGIPV